MREKLDEKMERGRYTSGPYATPAGTKGFGMFHIQLTNNSYGRLLLSSGMGWEHASVSIPEFKRCPTWEEMCIVKSMVWEPEETVVQYHPAESENINNVDNCLHLWRPVEAYLPTPPAMLVGFKKPTQDAVNKGEAEEIQMKTWGES